MVDRNLHIKVFGSYLNHWNKKPAVTRFTYRSMLRYLSISKYQTAFLVVTNDDHLENKNNQINLLHENTWSPLVCANILANIFVRCKFTWLRPRTVCIPFICLIVIFIYYIHTLLSHPDSDLFDCCLLKLVVTWEKCWGAISVWNIIYNIIDALQYFRSLMTHTHTHTNTHTHTHTHIPKSCGIIVVIWYIKAPWINSHTFFINNFQPCFTGVFNL